MSASTLLQHKFSSLVCYFCHVCKRSLAKIEHTKLSHGVDKSLIHPVDLLARLLRSLIRKLEPDILGVVEDHCASQFLCEITEIHQLPHEKLVGGIFSQYAQKIKTENVAKRCIFSESKTRWSDLPQTLILASLLEFSGVLRLKKTPNCIGLSGSQDVSVQ